MKNAITILAVSTVIAMLVLIIGWTSDTQSNQPAKFMMMGAEGANRKIIIKIDTQTGNTSYLDLNSTPLQWKIIKDN